MRALIPMAFVILALAGCEDDAGSPIRPDPGVPVILNTYPEWGPSGRRLAFTHYPQNDYELQFGARQIWVYDMDTGSVRYVCSGILPRWAPSGAAMTFVRAGQVYTIDLATGGEALLTPYSSSSFYPDWAPDGSRIAFDTDYMDPRGAHAIWIMRQDGSFPTDISAHGTGEWRMPRWSPDGGTLLHVRWLPDGTASAEVFLMDTTGGNPVRLTSDADPDYFPCWSPDGTRIAWSKEGTADPSRAGIWTMRIDGTEKRQVVEGGTNPSWSPDGAMIAFSRVEQATDGSGAMPLDVPLVFPSARWR
jgi:TolB protein